MGVQSQIQRFGWILLGLLVAFGATAQSITQVQSVGNHPQFPRETVRSIVEAIINGQFDRGDSLATVLVTQYPQYPWGYFYKGAILQARMIDRNQVTNDARFWHWMRQTISVADELKQQGRADPMIYFFKGSAYYYMAFHAMKLGNWWQAYRYTRKGVHVLEAAVEKDSTLWEAYLGIGAYKFWKSKKAGILRFLFLVKDEKDKGLQLVRRAVQQAQLVPELARDQLVYMLMEDGQAREAWHLARQNLQAFPESRFFLWTFAKASFAAEQWAAADSAYQQLWEAIRYDPNQKNNYPHVLARLTRCACELGRVETSRQYFEWLQRYWPLAKATLPEAEYQQLRKLPCLIGHVSQ